MAYQVRKPQRSISNQRPSKLLGTVSLHFPIRPRWPITGLMLIPTGGTSSGRSPVPPRTWFSDRLSLADRDVPLQVPHYHTLPGVLTR